MSGLDPRHLLRDVIRPALAELPPEYRTTAAEQIVLGTAAVESRLTWLRQHGAGPARGLWQMEGQTFADIRDRFLVGRPAIGRAFSRLAIAVRPEVDELCGNLFLGALCCRLKYMMAPRPLPQAHDVGGLALEWKQTYNTHLGAGKPEEFVRAWHDLISPASIDWSAA